MERRDKLNELLKVNDDNQTVSARDLHDVLEATERFSVWVQRYLPNFVEGEDFTSVSKLTVVNNGAERELDDYALTIDTAKHICLMSRTEKGKQCRQYLIDIEKAWNTPEQILARALKVADQTIASLNTKIKVLEPKAEFFDAVADSKDAISLAEAAKVLELGIGRNKLFEFLRKEKILQRDNQPYQKYVDLGYFRTIEQKYTVGDEVRINIKTLVYQKGLDYIRKKYNERYYPEPVLDFGGYDE